MQRRRTNFTPPTARPLDARARSVYLITVTRPNTTEIQRRPDAPLPRMCGVRWRSACAGRSILSRLPLCHLHLLGLAHMRRAPDGAHVATAAANVLVFQLRLDAVRALPLWPPAAVDHWHCPYASPPASPTLYRQLLNDATRARRRPPIHAKLQPTESCAAAKAAETSQLPRATHTIARLRAHCDATCMARPTDTNTHAWALV